jgi:hypothetical protein
MLMNQPLTPRPFRIGDAMVLVAATAVAFAVLRHCWSVGIAFTTFGGNREQRLFFWLHQVVPFPALWSLAVFAIDRRDRRKGRRRGARQAGLVACYAATVALAITALIASAFLIVHILEDTRAIPKVLSHPTQMHSPPPFADAPMEEIAGAAVLGAWSAMAAGRRWRTEPSWIDRLGRVLGGIWIGLFLIYVYGYTG